MKPLTSLALRHARLRKKSGGAAIFIVAVTLALLASMGIYGLTSTSNDIQAAGHLRQATQAQHVDEAALMAAAESFTPGTTAQLVRDMVDPAKRSNVTVSGLTRCKSANSPTTNIATQTAEACLRLTESQMYALSKNVNQWVDTKLFSSQSFGSVPQSAFVRVEITNPVEVPGPAGNSIEGQGGSSTFFAQVTATVIVDMKTDQDAAPESTVLGRARLTVGPYRR